MRHLCSTQPKNVSKARLLGITRNNGHLLVITSGRTYSNQELLVRPVDEWYCACASYGDTTTWNTRSHNLIGPDAETLAQNLRGRFSSATWTQGHKSLVAYYARSGCPARCTISTPTTTQIRRTLEFGSSRSLFRFNLKLIPFKSWTTHRVYLRFHHPSWLVGDGFECDGYSFSHNNAANMSYLFSSSKPVPSQLDTSPTYGQCIFTANGFANEGNMSAQGTPVGYGGRGKYDVWHTPANLYGYSNVYYYYDKHDYYSEHEITDSSVINQMCECIGTGSDVYLAVGPRIVNGISSNVTSDGMQMGFTSTVYSTRVELVFRLSGNVNN